MHATSQSTEQLIKLAPRPWERALERVETRPPADSAARALPFVALVALAAIGAGWAVVRAAPIQNYEHVQAGILLAALGLAAELLHFEHTRMVTPQGFAP